MLSSGHSLDPSMTQVVFGKIPGPQKPHLLDAPHGEDFVANICEYEFQHVQESLQKGINTAIPTCCFQCSKIDKQSLHPGL